MIGCGFHTDYTEERELHDLTFNPYADKGPSFRLLTWDTYQVDSYGKTIIGYRLEQDGETIASGKDFHCSPMVAIDSGAAALALLGFLTRDMEDHGEALAADAECMLGE